MANRGRTLKFTAVLVLTALALTGFTTRRGGGSHGHSSGSGGGCSSSHQSHDSSSSSSGSSGSSGSRYDDDDDSYSGGSSYGGGGTTSGGSYNRGPTHHHTPSSSSTGGTLQDAKVRLISCATQASPYATVEVTNPNSKTVRFSVTVTFMDSADLTVTQESNEVKVRAKGKAITKLQVGGEGLVDSVDHCDLDPYALPVS